MPAICPWGMSMLRRAALWLTVPALALTAACGGSEPVSDLPEYTRTPSTAEPTDAPTPENDPNRPIIELPNDVTVTFETPDGLDDDAAQLVADFEQYHRLQAAVNRLQDMQDPRWAFYMTDDFRIDLKHEVLGYRQEPRSFYAETYIYDVRVTALQGDQAIILYCEDQSRMGSMNPQTGEVILGPIEPGDPVTSGYLLEWTAHLVKDDVGTWRMRATRVETQAEQCRR